MLPPYFFILTIAVVNHQYIFHRTAIIIIIIDNTASFRAIGVEAWDMEARKGD